MNSNARDLQPEIMDQPNLDAGQHRAALDGLARLNFLSNSVGVLWPSVRRLALESNYRLRLLDIACGAGDIPLRLWRLAKRHNFNLEIQGCDFSAVALDHARAKARASQADIRYFRHDILGEPLPETYDIVISSLFLHHLDEKQALVFLRQTSQATRTLFLINDLRRSRIGYWLAWGASRLFTRSPVVHTDALLSVRAAWTMDEVRQLAAQAGLEHCRIEPKWPFRFLLSWERMQSSASDPLEGRSK